MEKATMAKTQEHIYESLDTPAILLDMDKLESNIIEMSNFAVSAGVHLRPHVKVHQCAAIARLQMKAGACGIEVGNVEQAAVMADDGIDDILIAHPFYGEHKLQKLKNIMRKDGIRISAVIDMFEQGEALSTLGQTLRKKIPVSIKVDTGINRYGVPPGKAVTELAKRLYRLPGIELGGIYAHEAGAMPTDIGVARTALEVGSIMCETARMLGLGGITVPTVSVGASPTFRATCRYIKEGMLREITEIHPGNCVIGDIGYMKSFGNVRHACAVTVLTSVVSTSHSSHVVIDAGFKTFGADSGIGRRDTPGFFWNGMASFGSLQERDDLWLGRLGAESGWLYYMDSDVNSSRKLSLGERLEIVPNNVTELFNLHERVYGVRNGKVESEFLISGRGCGS